VVRAARTVLVMLGTLLVLVGTIAGVVDREVLDAGRFTSHAQAIRSDPYVARQLGTLLTDRLLEVQPDLTAVRPLLLTTATRVNARPVLLGRAEECERERGQLPTFVAIDLDDCGDLLDVVDTLNGLG
jgi:hypothetical protein